MAPKNDKANTTANSITFETMKVADIPQQQRLGRTSKFLPILDKLSKMGRDEVVKFNVQKYTQIQGLRAKIGDKGFTLTTRSQTSVVNGKTEKTLNVYIYHTPEESKKE